MGRSMFRSLPAVVIALATLFGIAAEASAGWRGHVGGSWGAGSYGGRWGSVGSAPLGSWGSWGTGLGLWRRHGYGYGGSHYWSHGYRSVGYASYAYRPHVYSGYGYGGYYGSYYGGYSACTGASYNYYTARPAYRSTYVYTQPTYTTQAVVSTPVYSGAYVTGTGVSSHATLSGTVTLDSPAVGNGYVTGSVVSGEIVQDGVISGGTATCGPVCCNTVIDGGVIHSGATYGESTVIEGGEGYDSVIDSGDTAPAPTPAADAAADEAADEAGAELPAPGDASIPARDEAMLTISVPADAKIFVNGHETRTPGGKRTYVSRNLKDGFSYGYDVEARWVRNGETLVEKQHVDLRAGRHEKVELDFAEAIARQDAQAEKVETVVSLRVPAGAKVKLAGHATKGEGQMRVFKSRSLARGQQWKDYKIEVSIDRNGREVTRSKTITLAGGEDRNFVFDFNVADVADNR